MIFFFTPWVDFENEMKWNLNNVEMLIYPDDQYWAGIISEKKIDINLSYVIW